MRWQAFTGKEALLDGTGQSFAAVAAERAANTEHDTASADQATVVPSCRKEASHGRQA